MTQVATIVLVHGAGAGSWTWHLVAEALSDRGINSIAVDLPSADTADNSAGPHEDAAYVRKVIDGIVGPVVLVGNSYGGFVISEAGIDHPAVRRLVYLAAVMPDPGKPIMEILVETTVPADDLGLTFLEDGRIVFDPEIDLAASFQMASPPETEYIRAHLGRPMSLGTTPEPHIDRPAWESIPSTYIVCTEDRALSVEVQRQWAKERATDFVELPVDHCPQHSHAQLVVEILERLASED